MHVSTIAKGLWLLKESFPGKFAEITESMIEAWTTQMQDIKPADYEYAIRYLAANADEFPSAKAVRLMANSRHKPFKTPREVWEKVLNSAQRGLKWMICS